MAGAISALANFAMFFGGRGSDGRSHNPIVGILVMILAPMAAAPMKKPMPGIAAAAPAPAPVPVAIRRKCLSTSSWISAGLASGLFRRSRST